MDPRKIPLTAAEKEQWLNRDMPYRLRALRGLRTYDERGGCNGPLVDLFPSIFESSLMHCRSLMQFLGIMPNGKGDLENKVKRDKPDDVHLADFVARTIEPQTDILPDDRRVLLDVYTAANKGSAHLTHGNDHSKINVGRAAVVVDGLIEKHLYRQLGRQSREWSAFE